MGNPFSIPCDPCINKISNWIDKKVGYIHNLRRISRLWMKPWKSSRLSVMICQEGSQERRRRIDVTKACRIESLRSSYRYGKKVFLTLKEVEELRSIVFQKVTDQAESAVIEEIQPQQIIVGQEAMLKKAWKHLKEDRVGTMGMYGMGGVGKTTLLTQLNNKFSEERCGFDFVIWVVVSKELRVEKIQDEVAGKIGLGGEKWEKKEKSQKTKDLYNFLKKKRFLLFLDDIWEKVDLIEIGVPFPAPQNRCKVVFTTRSQEYVRT
ncbi:unnamed protein product [Microthlaspi erraticum]|uniref:NB-ARC domain-containing protein n=1 Tax=Microthlaspi erraticum TaxID=1685480 RepID=A0A6D2J3V9_9BRAS|nr:unnamed protein product [Microthlaspi erraticum]